MRLLLVLLLVSCAYAHVCSDVLPGGGQYGCPDPQTVEYVSNSVSANTFTIVSDITAKHVQFIQGGCSCTGDESDGCYDNNDYGNCNTGTCYTNGFTVQYFDFDVNQGNSNDLTFSSNPDTSYTLSDQQTERFDIYIEVDAGAPTQHFEIDVAMKGSLSGVLRPIYTLEFDWTQESGCIDDGDCSGATPACDTESGNCVECTQASHCDDSNDCTTESCSANLCNSVDISDGTSCSSGTCCSGQCDATIGNDNYDAACRSGPSCSGSSWEYSADNNGNICSGECTVCNSGFCNLDEDGECGSGEACNSGTCEASCADTCTSEGFECGSQTICSATEDCGDCGTGETCDGSGICVTDCTDTCTSEGYECGSQTICGATEDCGDCGTGETCDGSGICVTDCTDTCTSEGFECGSQTICSATEDCGDCGTGETCDGSGICVTDCTDTCTSEGFECGSQTICGATEDCGGCGTGETCDGSGQCIVDCIPDCSTAECGDNGCGGSCGSCSNSHGTTTCTTGQCVPTCETGWGNCDADDINGCERDISTIDNCGSCGSACATGQSCVSGACVNDCTPDCTDKECGNDGCGGSCSTCNSGDCIDYECVMPCTNSCSIDEKRCDGPIAQTCDDYDDDGCYEWGGDITCTRGQVCQSGQCVISTCNTVSACIDGDGCCPNACSYQQDTDCPVECNEFTTATACNNENECGWCAISNNCRAKDSIECDGASCDSNGRYCSSTCAWRYCRGTDSSCGCEAGICTDCPDGTACNNGQCLEKITRDSTTTSRSDRETGNSRTKTTSQIKQNITTAVVDDTETGTSYTIYILVILAIIIIGAGYIVVKRRPPKTNEQAPATPGYGYQPPQPPAQPPQVPPQ